MSIVKYIKNNIFGIFFLCILFLPVFAFAENNPLPADKIQGFDQKLIDNVVNYSGGSSYEIVTRGGSMYSQGTSVAQDGGDRNLFSSSQPDKRLDSNKLLALKAKLKNSGAPTDIINKLTVDNMYAVNTDYTSAFVYDPTPNSAGSGDEVYVAAATKDGRFLGLKNPLDKEVIGRSREGNLAARGSDGYGLLNLADNLQGVEIGTSLAIKNEVNNKTQEKIDATKRFVEADAKLKAAEDALRKNPNDVNLQKAVASATQAREQAKNLSKIAQDNLKTAEQVEADSRPTQTKDKCDGFLTFMDIGCLMQRLAKYSNLALRIVSFITYIVGTLFDYSLELSINSAQFLSELGVIEIAWTFIRDILNMTFIFILLWTAVQILLGNDSKYNAKKVLTNVVIVAILINFSLFGAKLMVDASNIVTLKIYESMKAGGTKDGTRSSISQRVMTAVGMSTLYNITDVFDTNKTVGDNACKDKDSAIILISVMGSIFLLILCLALGLAGILFLIRLVNIIILFIKSPLFVWGFVLPGSETMAGLKNKWWKEMKHVLTFPIMYMFWMFIAVLVFTKLGDVGKSQGGILRLICKGSADSVENNISIVAIFAIVIIFLMKTIEYGFTHITDGGDGAVGNKFGKNIADKFSGYQTALTKGLAKKAGQGALAVGGAAGSMSVGAAKGSLKFTTNTAGRGAGGIMGGINAKRQGNGFWDGAKDGMSNPGISTKEALRDMARAVTAKTANNGLANSLGITSAAAKLANKYNDPKNSDGKTKKEVDKERTAKAAEDEKLKYEAIDKQYKVMSKKDWDKKHPTGTLADYEKHIVDTMTLRTDALLGNKISGLTGKSGKTHIEELKEKAIIREKDPVTGALTGVVRFNEHGMHSTMSDIIEHQTTGAGSKAIDKTKFTTFRNIKAKARIKAISDKVKDNTKNSKDKKSDTETTERLKEEVKKLDEYITKIPDESVIDTAISTLTVIPTPAGSYDGKKLRAVNTAIAKYNQEAGRATPRADKLLELENKIKDSKKDYSDYIVRQKNELRKKQAEHDTHLAKVEEKEKNK